MSEFARVAPRLARAHAERREMVARFNRAKLSATKRIIHKQWLVEHRELQLLRAESKGSRDYAAIRVKKVAQARKELAAAEKSAPRSWEDFGG